MIGFLSLTEAVMRAYDRIRRLNVCLTGGAKYQQQ